MNFSHFRDYSLLFLIFLGHIVTVSRANLVRRSADPEPEYEFPRDDENAGDDVDDYMEKEFVIESQGQNFTVTLGETVRLPCKASSPAVVLLWTKDSIRYSLGLTKLDAPKSVTLENNDLVVHDVKMTDMGTYVCHVAGMPNKSVVHTLNMRPEIVLSRANLVRRSADPEPEHEFLGDPTKDTQNGENTADDVENYISLYDKDVVLESQGENFTVSLGQTVRLPCKASSRAALLSWTKDSISYSLGYMILDAPKSVTLENNDLVVHDVKMTDMGTYVCHIAGMPNKSVVHTLNVEKSPEIVSIHVTDEGILVEGMDVTITCNATGFPKPTLLWTKIISVEENMKLGIDRAEFGPNSVTIRNVTRSDAGAYACYALNNFNKGSATNITLHVLGKPLVHVHRTVNNSAPNLEVILECTVQGEPLSNIYWFKDGKRILDQYVIEMDEQSSTLKVRPYNAKTVGVFTCVAENSYGRQEETINLLKYPLIDTVTDTLNEKTFRWTVTSYLPLEQTVVTIKERDQVVWRNVSLLVPEANDHTYNVRYVLDRENHKPGNYSAILRVKMDGEWSDSQDLQDIELEPLRDYAVSPMTMNSIRTLCLIFVPGFHAFI